MPDPRIRIGFIGLSSKPDSWATLAHLPYLRRSPHYEIVALCNSTPERAAQAIAAHDLPPSTRAYASPAELAADPAIDLIVICTRVDTHHAVALPTLVPSNGTGRPPKAIFIEWPLAASTAQAHELLSLAAAAASSSSSGSKSSAPRTIIGLQARVSPTLRTIQKIVASGRLGAIHSVNVQAASGVWQHDVVAGARYQHFLRRAVGGNLLTIYGVHILDAVFAAVGELVPGSYRVAMGNLRPRMRVLPLPLPLPTGQEADDEVGNRNAGAGAGGGVPETAAETELVEVVDKDTPDQIMLVGRLDRGPPPAAPAMLSFHLRAGSRAQDAPGALWRIYGEAAELVVEFESAGPQIGQASKVQIHHFAKGSSSSSSSGGGGGKVAQEVEDVRIDEGGEEWTSLPVPGQNIGRMYEAFARGDEVPGWDVALKRHELIDEFWAAGGM
jgi:predicted dehydrogenase